MELIPDMEIDLLFRESIAEQIGRKKFDMWFSSAVRFAVEKDRLAISVPNTFFGNWIRNHYRHVVLKACRELLGREYPLEIEVAASEPAPVSPVASSNAPSSLTASSSDSSASSSWTRRTEGLSDAAPAPIGVAMTATSITTEGMTELMRGGSGGIARTGLVPIPSETSRSPRHHLGSSPFSGRVFAAYDSFVEGMSNRLAKSAADIAITKPGTINPIFLHGPTSVGKTHLLEGVYSEYRKQKGRKAPKYLTADEFTTQFVQGFRSAAGENRGFRSRFSDISLLIIDDIHFFKGKEATQMELIHLIDYLRRRGVQMIFSADRPLAELTELKSELVTRIESGIVCGIEPPERETLLGIFRRMSAGRGLAISDEVCRFVVSRFASHARQLSGALNRLHAAHLAAGRPFTIESASEILSDLSSSRPRTIRLEDIEKAVTEIFNIPIDSLRNRSKARQFSRPRMLAMWLARKHTRSALSEIGRYFGNRSHSTVVSAQKRVDSWLQSDAESNRREGLSIDLSETLRRAERVLGAPLR